MCSNVRYRLPENDSCHQMPGQPQLGGARDYILHIAAAPRDVHVRQHPFLVERHTCRFQCRRDCCCAAQRVQPGRLWNAQLRTFGMIPCTGSGVTPKQCGYSPIKATQDSRSNKRSTLLPCTRANGGDYEAVVVVRNLSPL